MLLKTTAKISKQGADYYYKLINRCKNDYSKQEYVNLKYKAKMLQSVSNNEQPVQIIKKYNKDKKDNIIAKIKVLEGELKGMEADIPFNMLEEIQNEFNFFRVISKIA